MHRARAKLRRESRAKNACAVQHLNNLSTLHYPQFSNRLLRDPHAALRSRILRQTEFDVACANNTSLNNAPVRTILLPLFAQAFCDSWATLLAQSISTQTCAVLSKNTWAHLAGVPAFGWVVLCFSLVHPGLLLVDRLAIPMLRPGWAPVQALDSG